MSKTIISMTIGATLNEDNLGPEFSYRLGNEFVKRLHVRFVSRTRKKWNVQFETFGLIASNLVWEPGSGEEILSALVEIDIQQRWVVVEPIHHTVTMMSINVQVDEPLELVFRFQITDTDRRIVEDAES